MRFFAQFPHLPILPWQYKHFIDKTPWIQIIFILMFWNGFFWVYNQKQNLKTPSDGTCLGEPLGGFCCCSFLMLWSSFIFILLLFFIHFQATLPCHWHSTLASQAREGFQQLWALPQLLLIASSFSSTTSATDLSGLFLPTGVFYLTLLPDIFGTTCFYQGFPGSR